MIISELFDAFQNAENIEETYNILEQYNHPTILIENIIDTIKAASFTEDEDQLLYQYLADGWMERYNESSTEPVLRRHIEELIQLALLLEDTDKIRLAAELTKNAGFYKRPTLSERWRKELSEIEDYSEMLRFFCIADSIADLDDNVTKELFSSYNYSVSDDEWKLLITSQLELKHVNLLERLYNVAGSAERFVKLSGMSWEQLTGQLESITDISKKYCVSAYILAAELRKAFDNDLSFTEQAERYAECGSIISANMTAYFAYNEFLRNSCISDRLTELLSALSPRPETAIHQSVIRLNMRCIDKCLDEELDITSFLECTRSVNIFNKDSRLKTITWEEMLDVSSDGFGTEKAAAQTFLDALFEQISDKKLLVYIFLNTYFGVFCDMKKFIFELADRGFDIAELFAEHPLWCTIIDVESNFRKLLIRVLRYDCSNITLISPFFKGILSRHDIIQIRIIGIGSRKDGERFIRTELVSLENEQDADMLISCIDDIMQELPEEIKEVKQRLEYIPGGSFYRYNSMSICVFGFIKTYKLITACKRLISAAVEKYGAESAIDIYMNSFLRTSLPLEVMCEMLYREHNISAGDLDMWLSEYQFGCQQRNYFDCSSAIVPSIMLNDKNGLPLPNGTQACDLINIHVYVKNTQLSYSAIPAEDTEKIYNPKYVHKHTEMKLKGCSEDINFALTRKFIIDQACDQAFSREIIGDLVRGLYLRISKCGFKNKNLVISFLNFFKAVNPFVSCINSEYRDASADKLYRKWHRVKPFVEEQYSHDEVYHKLLSLGLSYKNICYVYLNSPLRYEISVFDFMRDCLEDFITETTAIPEFRLLGCRNDDGTIRIAEVCGDNGYPAVITKCENVPEYKWFSFSPEYRLDGSIVLTDIKKHIQHPATLVVTSEESTNTFPTGELADRINEFFSEPEKRNHTDLYSVISEFSLADKAYIGDCFGENRIFARLDNTMSNVIIPLNISTSEEFELRSLGGFLHDKTKIYAMVPVLYFKNKMLMCIPTVKYDMDTDVEWETCRTENDVPLPSVKVSAGKYPYKTKVPNITNQFILTGGDMTLEDRIIATKNCLIRNQLNLSRIVAGYSESEVNSALKGFMITYLNKMLAPANFRFAKNSVVLCIASDDGYETVQASNRSGTNAVLLLRFMKYEQKIFYFSIEKAYVFDPEIAWQNVFSEDDIPDSAIEIENIFSDECDILIREKVLSEPEQEELLT